MLVLSFFCTTFLSVFLLRIDPKIYAPATRTADQSRLLISLFYRIYIPTVAMIPASSTILLCLFFVMAPLCTPLSLSTPPCNPAISITYLRLPSVPLDHLANMDVLCSLYNDIKAGNNGLTIKESSTHHIVLRPTKGTTASIDISTTNASSGNITPSNSISSYAR